MLATRGVAAAEPYLTRYLPALVLAAVLPLVTVVAIATQDLLSAVIVLPPCRWCPCSARWSGWPPATAPRSSGARCRRCPDTSST